MLHRKSVDSHGTIEDREITQFELAAAPVVWAGLVVLVVGGLWLSAGYLFVTDFAGPRNFAFPATLSSSAPAGIALAIAAKILPGEIVGKVVIFGALFVAAVAAYRALPAGGALPRLVASLIYVFNPFIYGRLHYGHVFLLAAYAILPWVAACIRRLLTEPTVAHSLVAAVGLALLGVFDLHMLLPAAVLAGAFLLADLLMGERNRAHLVRLATRILLTVGVAAAVSAYWLIPFVAGSSAEGKVAGGLVEDDVGAFRAVADPQLGLLPNVLGLYGFWAENSQRFASMKLFVPFWPIVLAALLMVGLVGVLAVMRPRPAPGLKELRPWALGLLLAAAVAVVLEAGVSDPHSAPIVRWLDAVFPLYRGMRDAGKWASMLALAYSQLIPIGLMALLTWTSRLPAGRLRELTAGGLIGLGLALPLYYGNGLLFGLHGQIKPSQYPAGWYAADRVLAADPDPGRTVFLPWHLYMSLSFVRNTNPVVASPAPAFFSVPVLISMDPEFPRIPRQEDPDQMAISALVAANGQLEWASQLAERNIKYVLVAREADWKRYEFLDRQAGLTQVGDFGSIVLYRNQLWRPQRSQPAQPVTSARSGRTSLQTLWR